MRIAYLIQCHKNAAQINRLIEQISDDNVDIYIHIDRKTYDSIANRITGNLGGGGILDRNLCFDVRWGRFSQVKATLALINCVVNSCNEYDYVCLLSGQDYPLVSKKEIQRRFNVLHNNLLDSIDIIGPQNKNYRQFNKRCEVLHPSCLYSRKIFGRILKKTYYFVTGRENTFSLFKKKHDFILYHGSQWWTIRFSVILQMIKYLDLHPEFIKFYTTAICSDESFFQTLYMCCCKNEQRVHELTYKDWTENGASPKTFGIDDFNNLVEISKEYIFARKFDIDYDSKILDMIDSLKDNN